MGSHGRWTETRKGVGASCKKIFEAATCWFEEMAGKVGGCGSKFEAGGDKGEGSFARVLDVCGVEREQDVGRCFVFAQREILELPCRGHFGRW